MRPEFIGALIALISSLAVMIVVTYMANRRMNKERILQKIDQQRSWLKVNSYQDLCLKKRYQY